MKKKIEVVYMLPIDRELDRRIRDAMKAGGFTWTAQMAGRKIRMITFKTPAAYEKDEREKP